ncbi:class I SAM-dependent methyltransferase [Chloroflexota bacterium]
MTRTNGIDYDLAAGEYAAHRRIHFGVLDQLSGQVASSARHTALEVGCGTGNYICALVEQAACAAYGLDASAGMLAHARVRPERVAWLQGLSEQLPFDESRFDLVFSVDLIHHVTDKAAYYRQVARILKSGGWVCTVTDSADIIRRREVLSGYFPETVESELARYPRLAQLKGWMIQAGLVALDVVTVQEPHEITSAQPFRDKAYSSLHLITGEAWQAGVQRLEHDLRQGPIRGMSRYACVWGRKW